jgi:SAM-dependent methyltransferase
MYWTRRARWDTGISPPELVRTVEGNGPERMPAGRALDLGCGTGTNILYLAQHGWQVTGIDFAAPAVARARRKLAREGRSASGIHVLRGDVTHLERLRLPRAFTLLFDLGCFHGIDPAGRARYAAGITQLSAPGATLLLYAFAPSALAGGAIGITGDALAATFAPAWTVERVETGQGPNGRASAWYWLRRAP